MMFKLYLTQVNTENNPAAMSKRKYHLLVIILIYII